MKNKHKWKLFEINVYLIAKFKKRGSHLKNQVGSSLYFILDQKFLFWQTENFIGFWTDKTANPQKSGVAIYIATPLVVEAMWFEHTASASRTQRSTKLSHASITGTGKYYTWILVNVKIFLMDFYFNVILYKLLLNYCYFKRIAS